MTQTHLKTKSLFLVTLPLPRTLCFRVWWEGSGKDKRSRERRGEQRRGRGMRPSFCLIVGWKGEDMTRYYVN